MKLLLRIIPVILFVVGFAATSNGQTLVVSYGSDSNTFCNGGAYLIDSASIVETSIWWGGGGTVLQQGGYGITGLCPGTYTVTFSYNGNSVTQTFIVGDNSSPCSGLSVVIDGTPSSAPVFCDGSVNAVASGGLAPYTYSWNMGATTSSVNNLCDGNYCVSVVDANGCAVTECMNLGANAGDTILVIDNTGGYDTTNFNGTIGGNLIEDCEIDFGAIDSAFAQAGTVNAGGIEITWVFVDTNGVVVNTYTETYTVGDSLNGYYTVSVTVFCPQRANGINTVSVTDIVAFGEALGIDEENMLQFSLINPVGEEIVIEFGKTENRQLQITDAAGRLLVEYSGSEETVRIPSVGLNTGFYTLTVYTAEGKLTKRILKQ